jgi:hypothetical protein
MLVESLHPGEVTDGDRTGAATRQKAASTRYNDRKFLREVSPFQKKESDVHEN